MAEKKKREVVLPPAPVPPPQSEPAQPKTQGPGSLRSMPRLAEQIPASILQTLSPNEVQRQEILYELMETERQYVKDLESLSRDYLKPLRRLNLLTGAQLEEIFGNIDQVIDCNSELLAEFDKQKKVSSLLVGNIGKSFHARSTLFKVYSIYCANQPVAMNALEELRSKNPALDQAIKELSTGPQVRYTSLENMLILPVQRLYKYPLFLENLLHYTGPTHRDFESIQTALTDIREIAELVDARVAEVHRVKKLKAVQTALHPKFANAVEIIVPGRHLMGEFSVKQNASLWGKSRRTSRALFFNDGLLLAEKSKKGLKVQRWLEHNEYTLRDSTTANSVEVQYVGGAADAWLCDSDAEKKQLLALAQQLCAPQQPPTNATTRTKQRDREMNNGSRSLSLRNVRLLLEKDTVASSGGGSSTLSASTNLGTAGATGSATITRSSLRMEAENAELAAMRLKLLEWRNLVDAQGVELANERKMRIALETKVGQLMEELAQERRLRESLAKVIKANNLADVVSIRPPSPPSKPLPAAPSDRSVNSVNTTSSSMSMPGSPVVSPTSSTSSASVTTASSTAIQSSVSTGAITSSSAPPASLPLAASTSVPGIANYTSSSTPTSSAASAPALPILPTSPAATDKSSPKRPLAHAASSPANQRSPGRTRANINPSPRVPPLVNLSASSRPSALNARISFFEEVQRTHEEKQIILSPRSAEKETTSQSGAGQRSRSAKRMAIVTKDEINRNPSSNGRDKDKGRLTRTTSADLPRQRDVITRK